MLPYPQIDPVIFRIGPLAVRWYGFMYLVGFFLGWVVIRREIGKKVVHKEARLREEGLLDSFMAYLVLGVIVGGRLGYCIFYNPFYYLEHPLEIIATWHGGMSFHGGVIGATIGSLLFCKRFKEPFFKWADRISYPAPIGLFLGRIANFINGELFGRPTDLPWAMVFPGAGPVPRHPSQLYEAVLEGPILFSILWWWGKRKDDAQGTLAAVFLIAYGVLRFIAEFFRAPDPQLGFIFMGWMTMGQCLSIAMIALGTILFIWRRRKAPFSRHPDF